MWLRPASIHLAIYLGAFRGRQVRSAQRHQPTDVLGGVQAREGTLGRAVSERGAREPASRGVAEEHLRGVAEELLVGPLETQRKYPMGSPLG